MKIDSSDKSKKGYVFTVDIELPPDLKELVDDFPLGLINTTAIDPRENTKEVGGKGGQEKLIAGHFDQAVYANHFRLAILSILQRKRLPSLSVK